MTQKTIDRGADDLDAQVEALLDDISRADDERLADLQEGDDTRIPADEWIDDLLADEHGQQRSSLGSTFVAGDVARWMLTQMADGSPLHQLFAAQYVVRHFGRQFVYTNRNRNLALTTEVLREFLSLSQDTVVWTRRTRCWRLRRHDDPKNRRMIDE